MHYVGTILFLFFLHCRMQMISIYMLIPGPSDINTSHRKQLLSHGGKLARIHHVVGEFTNCSVFLPFILITDNCIFFIFRWQVWLCSSPFRSASISILFRQQTQVRRA